MGLNLIENKSFECELVSWESVVELTYKLAAMIKHSGFKPDIVIAIARGGYVPARIICDRLDIYDLASIRITHYTGGSTKQEQARLSIPLSIDINGMNVLLVDDVDDTGDTFLVALEHLKSLNPKAIKIAVLHHKTICTLLPDYYVATVRKWRWIIYPWALTEDITGFINRMEPKPCTVDEAQMRLEQDFNIKLSIRQLEEIISQDKDDLIASC